MKILHLTDFHYSGNEKVEAVQKRLVRALVTSLSGESSIDYVFFTGDLVFKGADKKGFEKAGEILLNTIEKELNIKRTNIFLAPGNHDVNRGKELDDVKKAIDDISSNDDLDEYVTKNKKASLNASLVNLENYFSFLEDYYENHRTEYNDKVVDKMYSTHKRELHGKKIGITSINSAWRCFSSKTDYGKLLFPLHFMRNAYEEVKDCDIKILLLHHPLNDLVFWNAYSLEDIIHKDYHLMFSGHTHKNKDTIQLTSGVGIYHCTSSATLSLESGNIGYTIIDVDLDSFRLAINNYDYNLNNEIFRAFSPIDAEIPVDTNKRELNKLRETLKKRYQASIKEANRLFLSYKELDKENNFISLFTEPVLKSDSQSTIKKEATKTFFIENLVSSKDDYLIIGKDKSGKSAILYKILLETLLCFSDRKVIPLYIDCKSYLKTNERMDLLDIFHEYIEANKIKAEKHIVDYHLLLLLDNFSSDSIIDPVCDFKEKYKNVSVISTTSETLFNSFSGNSNSKLGYTNIFIHDITRTQIRTLTTKWPNIKTQEKEIVLDKINKLFSQLNIPSNYWTVSLFLWVFEKNSKVNFGNNFQLIELYIDNLLDKDNFVLSKSYKIDYNDLKDYLAELAYYLVQKYEDYYQISYAEWVEFTQKYQDRNRKFVVNIKDIIDFVIEKGIFKHELNEKYTFRLNGVFEYFLGFYISFDAATRNKIIEDDHFYLSFANEFEICAGFISNDKDFVERIFTKTNYILKDLSTKYNMSLIDSHLISKIENKLNIDLGLNEAMKKSLGSPLSLEIQDEIMETITPSNERMSEVERKRLYHEIEAQTDNYEKALLILSRVYRNSKLKNEDSFNNKVFDYILNSTCVLGFVLMDELDENKHELIGANTTEDELLKLITKFIPLMVQLYFHEAVIQSNLEIIIKDKIEELKKEQNGENQFKLFILYFSLIDLDISAHERYIPEVIDLMKISVLKNSSLMKLYLYLSLKVNGNKSLQGRIEGYIRNQELKLNNNHKRNPEIDSKISQINRDRLKNKRK